MNYQLEENEKVILLFTVLWIYIYNDFLYLAKLFSWQTWHFLQWASSVPQRTHLLQSAAACGPSTLPGSQIIRNKHCWMLGGTDKLSSKSCAFKTESVVQ